MALVAGAGKRPLCAGLLVALALGGCATELKPFQTDGCTLFLDRALIGDADWCHCCTAHDRLYWRGGTEQERIEADRAFRDCIVKATGDAAFADTMEAGVRLGGTPALPTPWRWAYGWPAGRGYRALTPRESRQAQRELARAAPPKICR